MPDVNPTLLELVRERFDVTVDPDSDGGQILNLLIPTTPLTADDGVFHGEAKADSITFSLNSSGVSVRAAQATDAIAFRYPAHTFKFTVVRASASSVLQVKVELVAIDVPLAFLHPAQAISPDTLKPATGDVTLKLPPVLLVVDATEIPPAGARLSPFQTDEQKIPVTIEPEFASIDEPCVVGFRLSGAFLKFGDAPEIFIDHLQLYLAPPALPALAMSGGVQGLHIGLGAGSGVTGSFSFALADGGGAARPNFLHNLQAELQLDRSAVTCLELCGQIHVGQAIGDRLSPLAGLPDAVNYTLALALDDGWQASLTLAASGGQNYIWRIPAEENESPLVSHARNLLGAYAVFTPLLGGSSEPLGDTGLIKITSMQGVAAFPFVDTRTVTLFGGELLFKRSGGDYFGALLLDIETELHVKLEAGITLQTKRPIKVRHKAIGLLLDFGANGGSPQLQPVFDPAQGFTLDLADPGLFDLPGLGDLLKPDGARIARENPLIFEVDLVPTANLGIVTIDRASVRMTIDQTPPGSPSITSLGAHLEAGLISGGGYLQIRDGSVAGSLDVALGMLGVRSSASLHLENKTQNGDSFTAVMAALAVEWPMPIPLATSGVGLFGLLGLFAMRMERNQPDNLNTLEWFQNNVPKGDVSNVDVWRPHKERWAFGAGAVLGTLEGGFLIHAKGLLMIELPGPRLLIVMNADILKARPPIKGARNIGSILALVQVTSEALTISIVLDYHEFRPLLEVRVPVEAFFNFHDSEDWRLDVGGIPPEKRVVVKFLESFRADGYFMIHGKGIPEFKPPLYGFALAVGVHVAFTWGPKRIGLYMTVVFEGDFGIAFKPFVLAGNAGLSGELHLFVLSLGISASAAVLITDAGAQITARVCAHVEFLFFEVEGCVTLELGAAPTMPIADPLVSALSLHARPPALLVGSATDDQPVDGNMCNAFHLEGNQFVGDSGEHDMPVVPIDVIPVLQLEMRPGADPACKFFNEPIHGLIASDSVSRPLTIKEVPDSGWMKRGSRFYHYRLHSVELAPVHENGAPLSPTFTEDISADNRTPATWWDRHGTPSPGVDNQVQLALLTWQVDPTPAAAERTFHRDEFLKRRWGTVCRPVVGRSHILWTFQDVDVGPSLGGWTLSGIAHRDTSDIRRAGRIDVTMHVGEPWRSPDPIANALVRVRAAFVLGSTGNDGRALIAPHTGLDPAPRQPDDPDYIKYLHLHPLPSLAGLANAVRLNTRGMTWVRILFFADTGRYENGEFELRLLDELAQTTGEQKIMDGKNSNLISNKQELLDLWGDFPAWASQVESIWSAWNENVSRLPGNEFALILLETALPDAPYQIDIGISVEDNVREKWGILAVEAETATERARFDFDNMHSKEEQTAVDGALHADQGKRALLVPNSLYEVKVSYEVATAPEDDRGNPDLSQAQVEQPRIIGELPQLYIQRFRFKTCQEPPARLDPWVMATDPAPSQGFFFFEDRVRVVLATNATRKLFAAYNRELFAVVKASSGDHPDPAKIPAGDVPPDSPVCVSALPGLILTPFDSVVGELLHDESCRNFKRESDTHELVTLDLPLKPQTDYILDMVPKTLSGEEVPPKDSLAPFLYRLHFTTSCYPTFRALTQAVVLASQAARIDRWLEHTEPLTRLAVPGANKERTVTDRELETALHDVLWGDLRRPPEPRVTVIWTGDSARPTPYGVLIETPEPLWRSRGVPLLVTEPPDDPNGIKRYRLEPDDWLCIPDPGAPVSCLLHSTAGDRTLIVLGPGARGATLNAQLQRTHHLLYDGDANHEFEALLHLVLQAAPWEEEA